MNNSPSHYLQQALLLAQITRGFCAPNPAVGAVVVKDQQVIAKGYHRGAGQAHAEVEALSQLSAAQTAGATVYVSLEPCCHFGKTPPCTELLIQHKVKAVYYGFRDPNPQVSGQGQHQLQTAGIDCIHLPLPQIEAFYQSYLHWTITQRPWVTAKLAISLDGKIAGPGGQRVAITGVEAQQHTHQLRKHADAILTSVRTVLQDDPQLNVRLKEETYKKPIYVLDSHLNFPKAAKLFTTAEKITLFHQPQANEKQRYWLESQGVRCVPINLNGARMDLDKILECIGKDGVQDLLVEAGGVCFEAFLLQKKVQRALVYLAPKWLGPDAQAAFAHSTAIFNHMQPLKWQPLGEDVMAEFILE